MHFQSLLLGNRQRNQQSTEMDDLLELLKPFARFLSYEENEHFQKSVVSE